MHILLRSIIILFLFSQLSCIPLSYAEIPHIPVRASDTYEGPVINVRAFGARGDARTDDTQAIQEAVEAARARRRGHHADYGYYTSFAEVFFPAGHYIVSDTINISGVNLRGEGFTAIEQTDSDKDIFFNNWAWRQQIRGLTFLGGNVQLNLGNDNVDTGHVVVIDCHFRHSSGPAVQMRKGSASSFFKVENCIFVNCEQAVIAACDQSVIKDTWISSSRNMQDKAVIENYGVMHIENMLGVPRVRRGEEGFTTEWVDVNGRTRIASNQRWIDNHGLNLHVRNTRFGGEGGGFPAVYNFRPFRYGYPVIPSSIVIETSWFYNAQDAAVVLKEIPNMLNIANCTGLVDAFVLRVDKSLDLDTYFDRDDRPRNVSINIASNYGGFSLRALPEQLLPYLEGEIRLDGPPLKGNWRLGQVIKNTNPAANSIYGWVCTEPGKPGTWKPLHFVNPD